MLVLTRKNGAGVVLTLEDGRTIELTVVEISRGRVKIGLVAPATIEIDRREVYDRKQAEAA